MNKLSLKARSFISVALFLVIFAVLLTLASLYDYQVSEILTKNALEDGQYHASDFYGVLFENIGSTPIYLFIMFALCVLFWTCIKVWDKKPYNIILAVVCVIGAVVAAFFIYKDAVAYLFDQVNRVTNYTSVDEIYALRHSAMCFALEIVLGIFTALPVLLATKLFKEETLKKLFWFIVASICAIGVANILMAILKGPVGRMRFRSINSDLGAGLIEAGELKGYTPWYKINGQPNDAILQSFKDAYGVEDAFKSFPSGHTSSTATVYCLIMIPTIFETKKPKLTKALCWILPIVWTMLVAISRIVVGAHYFSDVLVGGTLTFVCMIIFREIFICKGSHFFAMFPNLQKKKPVVESQAVENSEDSVQSTEEEK